MGSVAVVVPGIVEGKMAPRKAEQVAKLRKEVEQLQRESELTRQKVSECIKDLIQYAEENLKDEYLLRKVPKFKDQADQKQNPFIEQKRFICDIIWAFKY